MGRLARYVCLAALLGVFAAIAMVGGPAFAKVYTNASGHYSITVPDSWTAMESEGAVSFLEVGQFGSMLLVEVVPTADATGDPSFADLQTHQWCDEAQANLGGEYQVEPRAIVTADGRAGGECTITASSFGTEYVSRMSVFTSTKYQVVYVIIGSEQAGAGTTRESEYRSAVQSFAVEGDAPPNNFGGVVVLALSGILVFIVLLGLRAIALQNTSHVPRPSEGGVPPPPSPPPV